MFSALSELVSTQRSRPLSIAVSVCALFIPGALIFYLARPGLFHQVGLQGVILLSVAVSLPVVMLCFSIWYALLSNIVKALRILAGQAEDHATTFAAMFQDDPIEWPALFAGAWSANVVIFVVAVVAYFKPIRIGATFLLVAAMLVATWVLTTLACGIALWWLERRVQTFTKAQNRTV